MNEKDNENLTQVETSGKNGKTNEPNKHGKKNSPKMPVLNEYGCICGAFLLPPQKDDRNLPRDKINGKTG